MPRACAAAGEKNVYQKIKPILVSRRMLCSSSLTIFSRCVALYSRSQARIMITSFVARNSAGDQYGPPGSFLVQARTHSGNCGIIVSDTHYVIMAARRRRTVTSTSLTRVYS